MELNTAFCDMMVDLLGADEAKQLFDALEENPPTSIRLSRYKGKEAMLPSESTAVPWSPRGYYLPTRPTFTGQSAFHAGAYYVQEASSMLLSAIEPLLADEALTALDLCAAPGGKSTLLLDMLPHGSILLSNEVVKHRANILSENLLKWGNPNSIVTSTMPEQLGNLGATFDLILVDAPCSGEGMFRKDLASRSEWNVGSPLMCAKRQKDILADIWGSLKDGGLLVYSTCTMNRQENEDVVAYLVEELGAESISLGDLGHGIWTSPFSPYTCYRMMPHRTQGEGLFMAIVRKNAEDGNTHHKGRGKEKHKATKAQDIPQEVYSYLSQAELFEWELRGDELYAYPKEICPLLRRLQALRVPIISAGIPIASIKGKSIIPHTALALSTALNKDAFEWVELDDKQLIPYLSREAIQLDMNLKPGIKLVHHRGLGLGFVKHLGNRSNNLYPQEWRIRYGEKLQVE